MRYKTPSGRCHRWCSSEHAPNRSENLNVGSLNFVSIFNGTSVLSRLLVFLRSFYVIDIDTSKQQRLRLSPQSCSFALQLSEKP
jgi:hypothetical protein